MVFTASPVSLCWDKQVSRGRVHTPCEIAHKPISCTSGRSVDLDTRSGPATLKLVRISAPRTKPHQIQIPGGAHLNSPADLKLIARAKISTPPKPQNRPQALSSDPL